MTGRRAFWRTAEALISIVVVVGGVGLLSAGLMLWVWLALFG
jgi:hypothetical protein